MSTPLFRQEAMEHQREPIQGSVLLAASPRSTWLAAAAFVIAALLITYAWMGEFSRKAHVQGYLAPDKGLIKVYPHVLGTLIERRVEEGQRVSKGDVLAVISTERRSLSVRAATDTTLELLLQRQHSLESELDAQLRIEQLRAEGIDDRLANLEREQHQLDAAITTVKKRLSTAQKEAGRLNRLEDQGFIAATDVQKQQDRVLEHRGRLQGLERDRIALQGRLSELQSERATIDLQATSSRSTVERQIAEIRQERTEYASNSDAVISAPADGIVSTVLMDPGQQTRREAPLLSIIPAGASLQAKLLIPSHAIGFISTQQTVALRYDAFPYQRFGHYRGVVESIAKTLLLPGDTDLPTPLKEPAYLVTVSLEEQQVRAYGKDFPLQAGMALDGDVVLDRRSIIQWIFDPLFSLAQRT